MEKSTGKVLASIFWDQESILLIDYFPKDQIINAEYYSSLLLQLKDFLRKPPAGRSLRGSCSCTTMPRLTGHLQPRRNWPTLAYPGFQYLDHPPYSPDLAPSNYLLFPGLKNNSKFAVFRPTRRSLLPRRPGWTDKVLNFFLNGLKKLDQ